jgi:aminomethyltransferase
MTEVGTVTGPLPLRRTALYRRHVDVGARMVGFGGWEMPLQYTGIIEEHRAVRSRAGIFDLSHMGEVWISGPGAPAALDGAVVSRPSRLAPGRAHYSLLCAPDGGIIDDLIIYRVEPDRFLVVPNAANTPVVVAELGERLLSHPTAALDDATDATSLLAVQGPRAVAIIGPLTDVPLDELRYYAARRGTVGGVPALIARTGYTGEDGFELFVARDDGPPLWDAIVVAGADQGLMPCGLGARDTLRLEAGMPLYGNELDRDTRPDDAGLGRIVRAVDGHDFVGREAILAARTVGPRRLLAGLEVRGRGIARHGYPAYLPGEPGPCGVVTSGTHSPTLGRPIAMAFLPPGAAAPGTMVEVGVRTDRLPAEVVPLPFYRRRPD